MMKRTEIDKLILQQLSRLKEDGLIESGISLTVDMIVLGLDSPIDSITFVTLISELELQIQEITGQEFAFILQDLHNLNEGHVELRVKQVAEYIERTLS